MCVVTYNIHRCRIGPTCPPERIADVLAAVDADVIALQEVIGAGLTGPGKPKSWGEARDGWSRRRRANCGSTCSAMSS